MARLRNVALIIDATQPYDRKIVQGIAAYVREAGAWSIYLEENPSQKLPDWRRWSGDGIIANLDDRRVAEAIAGMALPIVGIGGGYGWYDSAKRIPYFSSNDEAIGRLAAEHLLDRGFQSMAFCGFPRTRTNRWSEVRGASFRRRVEQAGCSCSVFTGRHHTARHWDELQHRLAGWLGALPKPLGLMACDDVRARHVLEACGRLELRVPDDVAIVGVDNNEMLCELSTPPLTSVEQGLRRMGYEAARLLDRLMRGETPSVLRYTIDPDAIVTRRSTESLAVTDPDVQNAVRFIRDNVSQKLLVPLVATAIGVSRSTLERRFKKLLGRTVREEIERVQLDRAKQLILTTSLPLKQIAPAAGFRQLPYMTTLFRRRFGATPAAFRRETLSAVEAVSIASQRSNVGRPASRGLPPSAARHH